MTNRFFDGPNFVDVPLTSNGVNVGLAQVDDGLQRAEFWKYTAGTGYHVHLKSAAKLRVITVNVPAGSKAVAGVCAGSNHDIGEAFDDPFGNNAVPAWGHIGQQSGCQNNLEVAGYVVRANL